MNLYLCQKCGKLHEAAGIASPTGGDIKQTDCAACKKKLWCGEYVKTRPTNG